MANSAQAKKRARQAVVARQRNISQMSAVRTAVKKVLRLVESKDSSAAKEAYVTATSVLDRASKRGLIHDNKASRLKKRLNQKLKALAVSAAA